MDDREEYRQKLRVLPGEKLIDALIEVVAGNGFGFEDADIADMRAEILRRITDTTQPASTPQRRQRLGPEPVTEAQWDVWQKRRKYLEGMS